MSFFSTRISIQWPPEEALEHSVTMVSSVPSGKFVDLRSLKDPKTEEELKFPFEWAIIGYSTQLGGGKTQFSHEIDSRVANAKLECLKEGKKYKDEDDVPDIGLFSTLPDGDRREDGEMLNTATGKILPYIEIWRTIDGDLTTPTELARLSPEKNNDTIKYALFEIDTDLYEGLYITIGKWGQGILNRKKVEDPKAIDSTISCIRTFEGKLILSYGIDVDQFPVNESKPDWKLTEQN